MTSEDVENTNLAMIVFKIQLGSNAWKPQSSKQFWLSSRKLINWGNIRKRRIEVICGLKYKWQYGPTQLIAIFFIFLSTLLSMWYYSLLL
ncbi:unnamed protein product [Blepharisma stoltei]|uniref:Uncharacterized protein n=1 Tax=Blepharisma stoltei TaxID=1481888 RepID=A0AAU9KJU1_9CILI|nr:unnamed protein product [Blepharisma stoltei]